MNSPHEITNTSTPTVTMPFLTSGSTTRVKTTKALAPSTLAASSSSSGTAAKNGRISRIANGRTIAEIASTTPLTCPVSDHDPSTLKSGITADVCGTICSTISANRMALTTRDRVRASQYAAGSPSTSTRTVVETAICVDVHIARTTPSSKAAAYALSDGVKMSVPASMT